MRKYKIYKTICFTLIVLFTNSCIEPYDIKSNNFESVLVIEATITNEFKYQEINLSRTFPLEDTNSLPESNADVKIIDDTQNTFNFKEIKSGKYVSINKFKAQPNKNYQLWINTSDGKTYSSQPTKLTSITKIDTVYAAKEIDDLGVKNLSIFVDSFDPTGNSKYYRYEYEETFKIIAPKWNVKDLVVTTTKSPFIIDRVYKTKEERVCYKTAYSKSILQTETTGLSEDNVAKFPVRVLSKNNPIITYRYTILVKQYIQSLEAFTFYKVLNKLSGSESLFSQNQPGFFNGNVFSVDNPNEKVIGFFEVSSVSSKRIFINFQDYFSNEPSPPYFTKCGIFAPSPVSIGGEASDLVKLIISGTAKYYKMNTEPTKTLEGPYLMVPVACGDCTKLGTNVKPSFWKN